MERRTKNFFFITGVILALFSANVSSTVAMDYNLENMDLAFSAHPTSDRFTEIKEQSCSFKISKIQTVQKEESFEYSDEGYNDGDQPEEWGCMERVSSDGLIQYYSRIYQKEEPVSWNAMGTKTYSPHSKNSNTSVEIRHNSLDGNNRGDNHFPTITRDIEAVSIGDLSFDVMAHLNISSKASGYFAYGTLIFELSDSSDLDLGVVLVFETKHDEDGYYVGVNLIDIDPSTGDKLVPVQIFKGASNNFNWMNVQLFFDCYNDVYNLTIGQYNDDFSDWLVEPETAIIRGNQYNPETYELTNNGFRYAQSHLMDTLSYEILLSDKADNNRYYSSAYIDNVNLHSWKFPAVYADVTLRNATISADESTKAGIVYMKNSIISSYEPPKYPGSSYSISFNKDYLLSAENPGYITPWILAPDWKYLIPQIVTSNHELNVESILHILNDLDNPIEERGLIQPSQWSPYATDPNSALSAQFFEFSSEDSLPYNYYFKSRYSDYVLLVDYFSDTFRAGLLKSIYLYNGSSKGVPLIVFDVDVSEGWADASGGASTESTSIDGINVGSLLILSTVGVLLILNKMKKQRRK